MQLRVENVQLPQEIRFNYDELKHEISDKVKMYETLIYTDDQIKSAKTDRADLNRLKKALNDERIRREKEYMQPFNVFKAQINEIISIIDKPVRLIDERVKEFEEQQRQEKKQKIEEYFSSLEPPEWLQLSMFFDEGWLNASVALKAAKFEISQKLAVIGNELDTLSNLPEFAFEAVETYKTTLDINKAIAEGHRLSEMQKRKAEQERIRAEQEKVKQEQEKQRKEQLPFDFDRSREEVKDSTLAMKYQEQEEQKRLNEAAAQIISDMLPRNCVLVGNDGNVVEPTLKASWVSFKALLTAEDARELKEFFVSRNIEFSRI